MYYFGLHTRTNTQYRTKIQQINIKTKNVTGFFLDLAQDAEQRRLHSVTVERVFPVRSKMKGTNEERDLSLAVHTGRVTTCKSDQKQQHESDGPTAAFAVARLAKVSF